MVKPYASFNEKLTQFFKFLYFDFYLNIFTFIFFIGKPGVRPNKPECWLTRQTKECRRCIPNVMIRRCGTSWFLKKLLTFPSVSLISNNFFLGFFVVVVVIEKFRNQINLSDMKKMIKTKFNHEIHVSYKLVRIIYMYIRFQLGFFFNLKKNLINTLGYEKTSLVLTHQTKSIVF